MDFFMNNTNSGSDKPTYRIGSVSRLTGVAPDTLRVWERRYGAVTPFRSEAGARLYSQEDVGRLVLIKRLVDSGDVISRVANLTKEQLQERARGLASAQIGETSPRSCRILVLGNSLPALLRGQDDDPDDFQVLGLFRDREEFLAAAADHRPDVAVLEYPTIQPDQVREIGALLLSSGAPRALVVYGFAASTTLERLHSARVLPIRAPVDRAALRRWCLLLQLQPQSCRMDDAAIAPCDPMPPRRFDPATLARIAAAAVRVHCECPHHLVDLVAKLDAFEDYCTECEVLNLEDAALHAYLSSTAAHARALLESALERVIEADEIPIDDGE